jgi:16S rRNA G1207 methylase RsmC
LLFLIQPQPGTVTLPNAAYYPGREITMKQIAAFAVASASSNVQPLTSVTAGTAILSGAGKYAKMVSNGQVWVITDAN